MHKTKIGTFGLLGFGAWCFLAGSAKEAQAQWTVELKSVGSGTTRSYEDDPAPDGMKNRDFTFPERLNPNGYMGGGLSTKGQHRRRNGTEPFVDDAKVNMDVKHTVKARLIWQAKPNPISAVIKRVSLLITSKAYLKTWGLATASGAPQPEASIELGNGSLRSVPLLGQMEGSQPVKYLQSEGSLLLQHEITDQERTGGIIEMGEFVVTFKGSSSTNIWWKTYSNYQGAQRYPTETGSSIEGGFNLNAQVDNRTAFISRVGAPTPKRKGAPGVTINEAKDEWVNTDGTRYGHTTYSYNYWTVPGAAVDIELPIKRSHYNVQEFRHSSSGFTSYSYTWSPSDTNDTVTEHKQQMDFGTPELGLSGDWTGSATGQRKQIITYDLTDNSTTPPTTAKSRYELTVHDRWEKLTANVLPRQMVNLRRHPQSGTARCTQAGEPVSITCTSTFDWSVSGSVGGEPAKWMAGLLGISVGGSVGASVGAEASYTRTDIPVGWGTHLDIYELLDVHSGTADQWNEAGYVGVSNWNFNVPSSPAWGTQVHEPYYPVVNPQSTPSPGGGNG